MTEQEQKLTEQEQKLLTLTIKLHSDLSELPVGHDAEIRAMEDHIFGLQSMILSRPTKRKIQNDYFSAKKNDN